MTSELEDISKISDTFAGVNVCFLTDIEYNQIYIQNIFERNKNSSVFIYSENYTLELDQNEFFVKIHDIAFSNIYIYAVCGSSLLYYNSRDYYAIIIYQQNNLEIKVIKMLDAKFVKYFKTDAIGFPPDNKSYISRLITSMIKVNILDFGRPILELRNYGDVVEGTL